MSDLMQAALIGGGIFVVVMLAQYGRREHSRAGLAKPLVSVAAFGFFYLRDAPTATHGEWSLYAIGVALGLVFGALATVTTGMEVDTTSGRVMTVCGAGFVATWLVALAARLVFIWSATNVAAVHDKVGELMMGHQVEVSALPPFFVLWALTMVVSRVVVVQVRAHRLATAPAALAALTSVDA